RQRVPPCPYTTLFRSVMLEAELEWLRMRGQRAVLLPGAALRAVGGELVDRDAHRHAGAARVAVRPVGEDAAAAEAGLDQVAVQRSEEHTSELQSPDHL